MDAKLQRRIQQYGWDAAATTYDRTWRENLTPAHDAMFDLAGLQPGEAVLDVACGSGFVSLRAAVLVGNEGSVMATDLSGEMVQLTRQRAEEAGLANVETSRMDAESLDLPDNRFDVALCGLGLMFAPEPPAAAGEIYRTLKPGGRAVASVWGARGNCKWADIFSIVDSVVQSEVCPLFFALGAGDSMATTFSNAGFGSVESRRLPTILRYRDDADLLAAIIDGGAVTLAAKRFDAQTRNLVDTQYLASVAAYRQADGSYAIPAEFVVTAGRKA